MSKCVNGHELKAGADFCTVCGEPGAAPVPPVVPRAVEEPAAPSSPGQRESSDFEAGLRELEDLRSKGLITDPEYAGRRAQLLAEVGSPATSPSEGGRTAGTTPGEWIRGGLDALGDRSERRGTPRLGIALAAAGSALVLLGIWVIGLGELEPDSFRDDPQKAPGVVLSLLALGAGYAVVWIRRHGPLATAGIVASAVALPSLLFFLTYDQNDIVAFSVDAVLLVSAVGYGAAYLFGQARGHSFFLGGALLASWLFIVEQVESPLTLSFFGYDPGDAFDQFGVAQFEDPSFTTVGLLSFIFGAGYLYVSRRLDLMGQNGAAIPFLVAGHVTLAAGLVFVAEEFEGAGVGMIALIIGATLLWNGPVLGHRMTTWIGGFWVWIGVIAIVADLLTDTNPVGTALIAIGGGVVFLAEYLARALREPPDSSEDASSFALKDFARLKDDGFTWRADGTE